MLLLHFSFCLLPLLLLLLLSVGKGSWGSRADLSPRHQLATQQCMVHLVYPPLLELQ
jgi:hypothetical protein